MTVFGIIGTILLFIGTTLVFSYVLITNKVGLFLVVIIFVLASLFLSIDAYEEGYEKGQIDAIQGEIKYELRVTQDSTWIKKE